MLPPFIIEQIRRREEQERTRHEQPRIELPVERPVPRAPQAPEENGDRGVVIIDLSGREGSALAARAGGVARMFESG